MQYFQHFYIILQENEPLPSFRIPNGLMPKLWTRPKPETTVFEGRMVCKPVIDDRDIWTFTKDLNDMQQQILESMRQGEDEG